MRRAALSALFLMAAPALGGSPQGYVVTRHTLTDKNAVADIRIDYPQTGNPAIDRDILATVNGIATDFRKVAVDTHEAKESPFTLDVSYRIARNDGAMFDVVFSDEWDLHGAHPNLEFVTANYFDDDGWRTYLPEYLNGEAGLKRISRLAIADLDRRFLVPGGISDKDWIARGAGPQWRNFAAFVILPDALEIEYPPYQVASYADGPQSSRLALAALKGVIRADPRQPVPSFDCTRARSANEHVICSDVTLARLDRAVSEAWSSEMANENDPQKKLELKTSQTAWLARRESACSGENRAGCLVAYYRARLAALGSED